MIRSKLLSCYPSIHHVFLGRVSEGQSPTYTEYLTKAASAEQVHGKSIAIVSQFSKRYDAVDGLVSATSGGSLMLRTADCIPVLLFDPSKKIIAALHAGWKGLFGNIIASAVTAIKQIGGTPGDMIAVVGPHIGVCCYSVMPKRIEHFVGMGFQRDQIERQSNGLSYLDLTAIATTQLLQSGIDTRRIESVSVCTCCDERLYSYRRDGENTGRNVSILTLQ